jgi:hypothetical protein
MTIRTKVLAGDVDLKFSAVIRQTRLDFGAAPYILSDSVVQGVAAGDHYHYKTLWGASSSIAGAFIRVACASAWAGGNNWWVTPHNSFTYEPVSACPAAPTNYTRPGVIIESWDGTDMVGHMWLVTGTYLRHEHFTWKPSTSTWVWSGLVASRLLGATYDAASALPITKNRCFIVGVKDGRLWAQYNSTVVTGVATTLWNSEDLEYQDAFMCDAAVIPGTSNACLIINLASHGAAYTVIYDREHDTYSDPQMIAGGGPDDSALRISPVGLSQINSRLWLVTWRAFEGSEGVPYAEHMALSSSADGVYWREEGFIGEYVCFGRLLHDGGDYCYVVGNAAVWRAEITSLISGDPTGKKRDVDEAVMWRVQTPQSGGASNVSSNVLNATGSGLDSSPLFVPENQLELVLSSSGESDITYFTGILARHQRDTGYPTLDSYIDQYQVTAMGPIARLSGDLAYQPPGGIMFNSPTAWYSDFNSDGGSARLSVAGLKGTWNAFRPSDQETYALKGQPNTTDGYGLCTVPRAIHRPALAATFRFKAMVELEGIFFVLLYEDEDNYWRVGLYDDPQAGIRIEIHKIRHGILEAAKATANFSASVDTWYSMHVALTPGQIKLWLIAGETLDFEFATTCAYDLSNESEGLPAVWHAGICVLDRANDDDAIVNGTVTKSYPRFVWDESKNFTSTVLGEYLRVNKEWRRVVDYRIVQDDDGHNVCLTVDPALAQAPPVGMEYGVYDDEGDPYVLVRDLALCDCTPAWTLDDISTFIMELSGVSRTVNFSETLEVIASATQYRDFAVTITGSGVPSIILYASGPASYTGWQVTVHDTFTTLKYVYEGGTPSARRRIPHVRDITIADEPEVRMIMKDDALYIFADGQFLSCLPDLGTPGSGYVAKNGAGTYTIQEFGEMRDMFAWASSEKPNQCLQRLLRGRHAKLRELGDGSVELSRFGTRTDLGAWDAIVSRQGPRLGSVPSIIGMVGSDYLGFFIDPTLARKAYRFRRSENPTVETELETVNEARLTTKLAREIAEGLVVQLYAIDPEARIEDVVDIDSVEYIIDSLSTMFQVSEQGITHQTSAQLRKRITDPTPGVWGTDDWGDMYYG